MQRIRIKCLPGSSFKLSGSHFKKKYKKIKKVVDIFFPLLYTNSCVTERTQTNPSGCGSAWLERLVWDQEVAGSNPVTPTTCGCSSMVEHQPSKLDTWVRFPSPAFLLPFFVCPLSIYAFKLSYSCFYTYLYTKQKPIPRVSTKCIGFYYALDKICIP